jgi:hypothetical protein
MPVDHGPRSMLVTWLDTDRALSCPANPARRVGRIPDSGPAARPCSPTRTALRADGTPQALSGHRRARGKSFEPRKLRLSIYRAAQARAPNPEQRPTRSKFRAGVAC